MALASSSSIVAAVTLLLCQCMVQPSEARASNHALSMTIVDFQTSFVARSSKPLKSFLTPQCGKEEKIVSELIPLSTRSFAAFWRLRGGSSDDNDDEEETYEISGGEESDGDDEREESGGSDEEEHGLPEDGAASSAPLKLIVQTGLNCPLVDQSLEVTASRTRTVASIRQTVSRQMSGRPPISAIRLLLANRVLQDHEVLEDLLPEGENEDDDDDDGEDDGMLKLRLLLDSVPPVDPKFGVELGNQIQDLSTAELLEAWAANAAAAHENAVRLFDENNEREEETGNKVTSFSSTTLSMRRHAFSVKERIMETMPEAIELLSTSEIEGDEDGIRAGASVNVVRTHRKGSAMKGGASTHVKRLIQRNLNIVSTALVLG